MLEYIWFYLYGSRLAIMGGEGRGASDKLDTATISDELALDSLD